MSEGEQPESRRCPYCGCGFEPKTPEQLYCWPGCEEEDRKRREAAAKSE
jgi:hypothetical protein